MFFTDQVDHPHAYKGTLVAFGNDNQREDHANLRQVLMEFSQGADTENLFPLEERWAGWIQRSPYGLSFWSGGWSLCRKSALVALSRPVAFALTTYRCGAQEIPQVFCLWSTEPKGATERTDSSHISHSQLE